MTSCKTELGMFVRAQRLGKGWSQVRLASEAGVSQRVISAIETGDRPCAKVLLLGNLARVLGCEPDKLRKLVPDELALPSTERGRFIRARRTELDLSLEDLAFKMSVSLQDVRKLEMGARNLSGNVRCIPHLAHALEVPIDQLLPFFRGFSITPVGELGKLVQLRRAQLGMTRVALAGTLRLSRVIVEQIEDESITLIYRNPQLERLASALALDPDELKRARPKRRLNAHPRALGTLGALLTTKREELNYTQSAVARRAGVSTSSISKIECGGFVSAKTAIKIVAALDIEIPNELMPKK